MSNLPSQNKFLYDNKLSIDNRVCLTSRELAKDVYGELLKEKLNLNRP